MKQKLSLILAFLMLAASLVSCADTAEEALSETENTPSAETVETEAETEDPAKAIQDALPTGDYEGRTYTMLVPSHLLTEFDTDLTGDIIDDAVCNRNIAVEERLNVDVRTVDAPGLWGDRTSFMETVQNSVMAMDDAYQLVSGYGAYITALSSAGVLANWNNVSSIDFSNVWWNQNITSEMTINDRLYYVTGDLSLTSLEYLFCLFFNKQLVADFALENPYDLVREGKWTLDTLNTYTAVSVDTNGDGKMDGNDLYGYISDDSNYISGFHAALDADVTRMDENGLPVLTLREEIFTDKFNTLYAFLRENPNVFLNLNNGTFNGENETTANMFKAGQALIMADMLGNSAMFRDTEVEFGILPYPKYDEAQENYHTTAWDAYVLFCLPTTVDLEFVGLVTECLGAYSYTDVTPAFYEKALKTKYARDTESSEMIDIIRAGAVYNFGAVNGPQCNNCGHIFRTLIQGSNPNIASYLASNVKAMEKALERFVNDAYFKE